jgi:hypothetical protein
VGRHRGALIQTVLHGGDLQCPEKAPETGPILVGLPDGEEDELLHLFQ